MVVIRWRESAGLCVGTCVTPTSASAAAVPLSGKTKAPASGCRQGVARSRALGYKNGARFYRHDEGWA